MATIRLATGGWDNLLADHARYVFSGMSLLDGRGYVGEAGETFYVRAPVYPVIVGGGWALAGADGAHLAAWGLGLAGLLLAVWLAAHLGGLPAAFATAAVVIAVPQFWAQIVSLGIDLPQVAVYLAAVALLLRPMPIRWLAGGCVMGIALLIKETVAPAVLLLPMAWLPAWSGLAWRTWAQLVLLFLLAVAVVAGWWWFLVWRETGLLFPFNSLRAIVRDEAEVVFHPTRASAIAWLLAATAWAYLIARRYRDAGVRLLVLAAIALAPAVAATVLLAQPERNLTALVLLSCIAAGVALADLWRAVSSRSSPAARLASFGVLAAALMTVAVLGQLRAARATQDRLPGEAAAVIRPALASGQEVISTFRGRSPIGLELFDANVRVELLPVGAVRRPADPSQYLWLGERRGTLFGMTRDSWQTVLSSPRAAYLVLIGPHLQTPVELLPALRVRDELPPGLTYVKRVDGLYGTADIFEIDPARIDRAPDLHLHAKPGALEHWLDMAVAAGTTNAAESLLDARPIVPALGTAWKRLARRLGPVACFRPMQEDGQRVLMIEPTKDQSDCMTTAALDGSGAPPDRDQWMAGERSGPAGSREAPSGRTDRPGTILG